MGREQGTMEIDFRRRAVKAVQFDGEEPVYQVIYYGLSAKEVGPSAVDLPPYADLSVGGRRSGNPIELEYARRKHFFNKRIMDGQQEGETQARKSNLAAKYGPVQGGGDAGGVGARDGGGGAGRAEEAEAAGGSAGRGDRDANNQKRG